MPYGYDCLEFALFSEQTTQERLQINKLYHFGTFPCRRTRKFQIPIVQIGYSSLEVPQFPSFFVILYVCANSLIDEIVKLAKAGRPRPSRSLASSGTLHSVLTPTAVAASCSPSPRHYFLSVQKKRLSSKHQPRPNVKASVPLFLKRVISRSNRVYAIVFAFKATPPADCCHGVTRWTTILTLLKALYAGIRMQSATKGHAIPSQFVFPLL
uniref:Uncharacterized protein n=1 Tax=Panagrellus redivivus TaxID=6233 RepID=A0A7E4UYT4_PANRE